MIAQAASRLAQLVPDWPRIAIVLGSAQAAFINSLTNTQEVAYRDIPGWPAPSVPGHAGKLILGDCGGRRICVLAGRVHLYEGRTPLEVTFGVRVLGSLGTRVLFLTNAAGGINPSYSLGLLVLLTDHINLQGQNPLIGPNDDSLGTRFPDMTQAYDRQLRQQAQKAAAEIGISLGEGVYAGLLGPSFETPAEIRYLRTIGADLAGMSTVPETIVARHMGIRVMGISTVTNMASGMQAEITHEEVLAIGKSRAQDLFRLLEVLLPRIEV